MSDVPTRQLVDETTQRVLQLLQQSGMLKDAKIDGAIIPTPSNSATPSVP